MTSPFASSVNSRHLRGAAGLVSAAAIVVGVALGVSNASSADQTTQKPRTRSAPAVNVTISSRHTTLLRRRNGVSYLVLSGYGRTVEVASVSPGHDRITVPTALWARGWKALYSKDEPNVTLAFNTKKAGPQSLSFTLASGTYNPVARRMVFKLRPLGIGSRRALPVVSRGARPFSRRLGATTLYVDPSTDYGGQTETQNASALQATTQMLGAETVSTTSYTCCGTGYQPPEIENGLPAGTAYQYLLVEPGWTGTITFSGAPAFGGAGLNGAQNVTFQNGTDNDGATFGVSGGTAFNVTGAGVTFGTPAAGSTPAEGIENLVIYGGAYGGSYISGELGSNSSIISADMTGATLNLFSTSDAVLANVNLSGATIKSGGNGITAFNDSALIGVNFSGITTQDVLNFNGTSLTPYNEPNAEGGNTVVNTSFANSTLDGFAFGPSLATASEAGGTPPPLAPSAMDGVSFEGATVSAMGISYATITGTVFDNINLADATAAPQFQNNTFDNATTFNNAKMGASSFTSCIFTGTDFSTVTWDQPVFQGTAGSPTELTNVTFNSSSFKMSNGDYGGAFDGVTFNGTTFVGLDSTNSADVAFISGIMSAATNATADSGLIAFNTQYVKGQDSNWYSVSSDGTTWTPVNTTTLEATGPPVSTDPTQPVPTTPTDPTAPTDPTPPPTDPAPAPVDPAPAPDPTPAPPDPVAP